MTKDIDFIPVAEPDLSGNELKYVSECVESGWISSAGKFVDKFEEEFSKKCDCKFGATASSGTAALHMSLIAAGVSHGDEVIIPAFTYVATANVVKYIGAIPVLVDADIETWNIDVSKIEEKITSKTKAIIPAHLYGNPCDMDKIMEIASKHNLVVIEDAAESHGSEYKGKKIGSIGKVGCFSFYGNKTLTTGEGGMCVSNDKEIIDNIKILRNHGSNPQKRYWHDVIGFNYRMTNMQAAIGVAQVERFDELVEKKRANAALYNSLLQDTSLVLPIEKEDTKNTYWMYCVLAKDKEEKDMLVKVLKEANVDTRPFFYPVNSMPPFKSEEVFPVAQELSDRGFTLPSSVKLTKEDIKRICSVIKENLK